MRQIDRELIDCETRIVKAASESLAENLSREIYRLSSALPDGEAKPVSRAMTLAYVSRLQSCKSDLEQYAAGTSAGDDIAELSRRLALFEIPKWIPDLTDQRRKISQEELENTFGDFYVSVGRSYSETKRILQEMQKASLARDGPAGKRAEAVKMLDAIIANGWSYARTAREMCDCGSNRHSPKCADRVRKRIRELENFLAKEGIEYPKRIIPGKPGSI